jgi:hypothetical protein
LNLRTVIKYLLLSGAEYETFLNKKESRGKRLDGYESFVKTSLQTHPAANRTQVNAWLKKQILSISPLGCRKGIQFCNSCPQAICYSLEEPAPEYFVIEKLPYDLQAQADFGTTSSVIHKQAQESIFLCNGTLPLQDEVCPLFRYPLYFLHSHQCS